jgi:2-keto-3-deoxy-L-arabinonate dehydratase
MKPAISGVLPVVHLPYLDDLSIDYATLEQEIDYLFATGAHGFSLALVSDLLRLTAGERLELPARLVAFARQRGPVIISVGAESTRQARQYARAAEDAGAAAIMAIPPISQALSEPQLQAYFQGLLEEVAIPLLVQDASSYVGRAMSLDFQAQLFQQHRERILFKPEASPLGPCISALRDRTGGQAPIFEGSGGILLVDAHRRGIRGTIPGVDLLDGLVALWQALEQGDDQRAYAIYFPVCALATLQLQGGLDGFIVIERYLMHRRGIFKNQVHRGPLGYVFDSETRAEVDRLFAILQRVLRG